MNELDPRTIVSRLVDAALTETRTWSTDEVRQMMTEVVAVTRAEEEEKRQRWRANVQLAMDEQYEEVVAAEREACALFVNDLWENGVPAQEFAAAIRARGKARIP